MECDDEKYFYTTYKNKPIQHGAVIDALLWYMIGDKKEAKERGLDVRKGIRLTGNTGSGKTMLFKIFQAAKIGKNFNIKTVLEIVDTYNTGGKIINSLTSGAIQPTIDGKPPILRHLMIDDLGKEPLGGHFEKKNRNVIGEIIDQRYTLWTKHGLLTHFTDNLLNHEVEQLYGDRIAGRIFQMTNQIFLGEKEDSVDFRRMYP